jgi:enoyl-CoA hydratase/carnithine racemase
MITSPIPQIVAQLDQRVFTLSLNRPERKNALTLAMYSALADLLKRADADGEIRVIVLTGNDEFFTSGNDLMDFMNEPEIHENHPVWQASSGSGAWPCRWHRYNLVAALRFGVCGRQCTLAVALCEFGFVP